VSALSAGTPRTLTAIGLAGIPRTAIPVAQLGALNPAQGTGLQAGSTLTSLAPRGAAAAPVVGYPSALQAALAGGGGGGGGGSGGGVSFATAPAGAAAPVGPALATQGAGAAPAAGYPYSPILAATPPSKTPSLANMMAPVDQAALQQALANRGLSGSAL